MAVAWLSVSALDGRPLRPAGTSHSETTLRRTLSRACALRMLRLRMECSSRSVRVLHWRDSVVSHWSTSSADNSRSFRLPSITVAVSL